MDDIVNRLREASLTLPCDLLLIEAANEIERLQSLIDDYYYAAVEATDDKFDRLFDDAERSILEAATKNHHHG